MFDPEETLQAFYFLSFYCEVSLKLRRFCRAWRSAQKVRCNGATGSPVDELTWMRTRNWHISDAAEKRSLCVLCCTIFQWMQSLMPISFGLLATCLGAWFHRPGLVVVGCVWSVLLCFMTMLSWRGPDENDWRPGWIYHYFPQPEILQEWASKWCNLSVLTPWGLYMSVKNTC